MQDKFRIMIAAKETLDLIKETGVDHVRMENPNSDYFGKAELMGNQFHCRFLCLM